VVVLQATCNKTLHPRTCSAVCMTSAPDRVGAFQAPIEPAKSHRHAEEPLLLQHGINGPKPLIMSACCAVSAEKAHRARSRLHRAVAPNVAVRRCARQGEDSDCDAYLRRRHSRQRKLLVCRTALPLMHRLLDLARCSFGILASHYASPSSDQLWQRGRPGSAPGQPAYRQNGGSSQ
jgi:hypothetical protein